MFHSLGDVEMFEAESTKVFATIDDSAREVSVVAEDWK